jgi:O-antigen ligase
MPYVKLARAGRVALNSEPVTQLRDSLWREVRAARAGEWLAAALLVSAFYLVPVAGNGPWSAALVATCLGGGVALITRRAAIGWIPLVLVVYIAIYALSGLVAGHGGGSDVARYVVRPAALVALSLMLTTSDARRRVLILLIALTLPQVVFEAVQAINARIDLGENAGAGADGVTGTFGDYGGGPAGLVASALMCLAAGLVLARCIKPRTGLLLAVPLLLIQILTATRAAVVFVPVALVALIGAALIVGRGRRWRPTLAGIAVVAALSAPLIYAGTIKLYPGSFTGAFSNQTSSFLGNGVKPTGEAGDSDPLHDSVTGEYNGPKGVSVLPGRFQQIKDAARLSKDGGVKVLLTGRGYGVAAVDEEATVFTYLPPERRVGVTWIGKILAETGWLGLLAFLGLLAWLAAIGFKLAQRASGWDRALGFALPGIAALTLVGAAYTTVLDVRPYSAAFIVLAAAGIAAVRDVNAARSAEPGANGEGHRAQPAERPAAIR